MHGTSGPSLAAEASAGLLDRPTRTDSDDDFDLRQFLVQSEDRILSFIAHARSSPLQLLARIAWFLVPSFLQGRSAKGQAKAKLGPTAYLDGIRGVAALAVFFCHYSALAYDLEPGWGCGGGYYGLLRLPILRLLFDGSAAVALFFVVSGYALSYRPVKMIRSRQAHHDFGAAVSSMVFRRGLRLYLPTIASTGLIVIMLRLGFYEPAREFSKDPTYFRNKLKPFRVRLDSGVDQWMDWANNVLRSLAVFRWGKPHTVNTYDGVLWTIPVEYRSSLFLFLFFLGTSRLKTRFRIMALMLIAFISYRKSRWDFLLFLCGMALVEWDCARGAHTDASTDASTAALLQSEKKAAKGSRPLLKAAFWNTISILGMYLLSQPDLRGGETPGWVTLETMIPQWWEYSVRSRYWQTIGAGLFLLSVGHSAFWQRVFTTDAAQYLGRISFSLYLVHTQPTRWMQYGVARFVFTYLTGVEGDDYYRGHWLNICIIVPVVICFADVFWRAVDVPIVNFTKWFEKKLMAKDA